jgi:effector-binding domain-containing protein
VGATVLYRVEVRDVPETIVASICGHVSPEPVAELDAWIIDAIQELFGYLHRKGVRATETPFAILPPPEGQEPIWVKVALPALRVISGHGRVEADIIPACRALVTRHHGPWSELVAAYHTLWRVIEEHDLRPTGEPREVYLTNPLETPPENCETELLWPISAPDDWELPEQRSARSFARG